MNTSQFPEQRHDNPSTATKLRRYLIVTVVATPANLLLYLAWLFLAGVPALAANVLAATLVSIPTYVANRRWVWQLDSSSSAGEAVQYWGSTLCSVVCSSAALWLGGALDAAPLVLAAIPLCVYAVLWILRYWFLDQVLFGDRSQDHPMAASRA